MQKRLLLPILVIAILMVAVVPASAGLTWCMTDPPIKLPDNGGVFHVKVAVPEQNRHTGMTLYLTAPAGSQLVGGTGNVDITVDLGEGAASQVTATISASFPVELSAQLQDQQWKAKPFDSGVGTVTWVW